MNNFHKRILLSILLLICLLSISCKPNLDNLTEDCVNAPVTVPTLPAFIPGKFKLDPSTGLHRTGDIQEIDPETYRLDVIGLVEHPLSLTYEQLRCMPKISAETELVCPLIFTDNAEWTGVRLAYILNLAGVKDSATTVRLTGADGYYADVLLEDATSAAGFLAYEWEGKSLPIMHGFPLRAVFPKIEGSQWVKWLVKIEVQ